MIQDKLRKYHYRATLLKDLRPTFEFSSLPLTFSLSDECSSITFITIDCFLYPQTIFHIYLYSYSSLKRGFVAPFAYFSDGESPKKSN